MPMPTGRHSLPVKRAMTLVGLLLLGMSAPQAFASSVYRCDSPDGVRSYASKRIPGASCTLVGNYRAAKRKASAPKVATWVPPPAVGSAAPSNAVSGSPLAATVPASAPAATGGSGRVVRGQVYSYMKDGVRTYTSVRPKGVATAAMRTIKYSFIETCYACSAKPGVNFGKIRLNTAAYNDDIASAARQHGVDEAIVRAIIHAESAFNPNALSRVGAQGLMQLMPATARRFGVSDAFNPQQNIQGGVKYLAWLLKRFNGNLTLAAAGYNAGEGAVDRHKGVPPYSETRRYVERVNLLADRYRADFAQHR